MTAGICLFESFPGGAREGCVAGGEQAAPEGQQVGDEADGEAELLADLGGVAMRSDRVRREVLQHEACVGARLRSSAGARDARLGVDDDAPRLDGVDEGREREQRGGRVAAWVGDERRNGWPELGQPVAPGAGDGAVPVSSLVTVDTTVRARKVDDDGARWRLERRR